MSTASTPARAGLATHYLRYLGSNVLVVAAGFVSFPLMARLLETRDFGLLGYWEAWALLAAGLLKLGTQHQILRFFPHGGDAARIAQFRRDHVRVPFLISLALWGTAASVAAGVLLPRLPSDERAIVIVLLAGLPLVVWASFVEAIMYALERSDITVWLKSSWRWGELVVVLTLLLGVQRGALPVVAGKLAVLLLVALWLTRWFRRWSRDAAPRTSRAAVFAGLAFGLPMMANELTQLAFGFADRILLRWLTGSLEQVGTYTIGYGLAMAVSMVIGATLGQTFTPSAIRLYETQGAPAVVALKQRLLDVALLLVSVIAALLLCAGDELLVLLAGVDKAASAPVFVIVSIAIVVYSLFDVAQCGMLLQKRAMRYLSLTLVATLANVALNLLLIPRFGVLGAAASNAGGFALLALLQYQHCPPELRYLPSWRAWLRALALPLGTWLLLRTFGDFGLVATLPRFAASVGVVLLPAAAWLAIDGRLHAQWRQWRATAAARSS